MELDILAVQRIYGSRTDGPLNNGNHVFGFNCNIAGDLGNFFNFTINRHPVVTVWATGANNWLDLSGWNTPATIDITRGAFCSANGMVNNICIGGESRTPAGATATIRLPATTTRIRSTAWPETTRSTAALNSTR